jgi:hypothetical protein
MNALASGPSVLGDFGGATLRYGDSQAVFRKEGDLFLVDVVSRGTMLRRFKVTRTIGWRYLQEYVVLQTQGPEPARDALYTEETRLKFGYDLRAKRWLPQQYYDAPYVESEYRDDGTPRYDPFLPDRSAWNTRCIHCHNTYPYEIRLFTGDRLQGFPPAPERMIERLLELRPEKREQLHQEVLPTSNLISVGISCESCHFGGRVHAGDPKKAIRFVPTHPLLAGWTPDPQNARKNPQIVNSLCRQCHFSGSESWPDGSAYLNSMESVEQDRGACAAKIKCTDCHNPHLRGPDAGTDERREAQAACLSCHDRFRAPAAQREHARHDPGQASCLDCHMPRIVHGFGEMNRSHRISSPTEEAILGSGMPNACNLCHLDRSLAWTRDMLLAQWGKRVALPRELEREFGEGHSRPAGEAWLRHPGGMARVVAAAAIARSPLGKKLLPELLRTLGDPNAYLRACALDAVERTLGRRLEEKEFDLVGPPAERDRQLKRLIERYQ